MIDVAHSLNIVNLKVLVVLSGFENCCKQLNDTDGDISYETQEQCNGCHVYNKQQWLAKENKLQEMQCFLLRESTISIYASI